MADPKSGRARRIASKIKVGVRRAADLFPLTPLGILVIAGAAAAGGYFGLRRSDLILLVVGVVTIAIGALALVTVLITAIVLAITLRKKAGRPPGDALNLECGHASSTGFSLPTLWYVPFVRLTWTWAEPLARVQVRKQRRAWHEHVVPLKRGLVDTVLRRVDVSDAFGLARITLRVVEERSVRLFPSVGALKHVSVVRSLASGEDMPFPGGPPEGERSDLRRYVPGDPVRYILWKVFAKSRQLVVRTPEQAISPARQTFAYVVTGEGDEAAAGTARVAVETGALGSNWTLGADGTAEIAKQRQGALEVIARSASCPADAQGVGLGEFLKKHVTRSSRVVVFVPARQGAWLDRVASAARTRVSGSQRMSDLEIIVCADGIERRPAASWLRRVAFAPRRADPFAEPPPVPAMEIASVSGKLGSARARVLVVDRRAGAVYGEAHQKSLARTDAPPSKTTSAPARVAGAA